MMRRQGYRPVVSQLGPRLWVFGGLGSRGLLYHALLGRELAQMDDFHRLK